MTCDCNYAVTVSSTGAKNLLQGDENGHVGRPCEVSLAPPYPELFTSYGDSAVTRTSGRGHVAEAKTNVIEVGGFSVSRTPAGCALGSVGNPFDRVWPPTTSVFRALVGARGAGATALCGLNARGRTYLTQSYCSVVRLCLIVFWAYK